MTNYTRNRLSFLSLIKQGLSAKVFASITLVTIGLCLPVKAAEIAWDEPQDITGELADFETEGTLVYAWNGGGGDLLVGAGSLDLQFEAGPDLANGPYGGPDPHNRGEDQSYESLIDTMTWASSTETISFTGLALGTTYRVQLWMADSRPRATPRQKTYDSGAGTSAVVLDSGPPSEFVIGDFVANGTSQALRFVGSSGETHPQYNAIMLREIGPPVPVIEQLELVDGTIVSDSGVRVESGNTVTLRWNIVDANSVVLNPGAISLGSSGSRSLSPTSTQEYTVKATNSDGSIEESITVYVDETVLPIRINELMSSNDGGIEDFEGDREDWLELYNPNPFALGLGGYSLTDDPALKLLWAMPENQVLDAGSFLVLFASDKDLREEELHTDFKLSSDGDYIALVKDGVVVGQLPEGHPTTDIFPAIITDVSYGYDVSGELLFFNEPTPGEENGEGYIGFLSEVEFSLGRGLYDVSQSLNLTTKFIGTTIRYTTDGSFPSESNGTRYVVAIDVDETMVVRAAAFKDDYAPSEVTTYSYIFVEDVIESDVMDTSITESAEYGSMMKDSLLALPTISLSIPEFDLVDNDTERLVSVEYIPNDGAEGFQIDAGVTHFGGYFTDFDKKSFRLYFRKEYGPGKLKYPLYEGFETGREVPVVDEFDSLDLRSGSHDMAMRGAYLANRFTDDSMLEMGHFNPHGRFVHVYINGEYWGQYHLRERWSASMAAEYFGGDKDDYEAINGNANVGGWSPGVAYDGDGSGWTHIKNLAAGSTPWEDLPARVDLDAYVDYILLYATGSCENEYRNINQPFDGGVGMQIYLNDADGYLRSINGSRAGEDGPGEIMGGLKRQGHPDFMMYLADRIQMRYFDGGVLTPEQMVARLQRHIDATELSFLAESARWGYRTPQSWRSYQDNLIENDLPSRAGTMISAFRGEGLFPDHDAPLFNKDVGIVESGFELQVSNSFGGTTYYTTNGEDPRLLGGAVNPDAVGVTQEGGSSQFISSGSTWKYLDNGSNQGTGWRGSSFNDSSWSSGTAQLGYGDGDEETELSYGSNSNNKYVTTYFRKTFSVESVDEIGTLNLDVMRDDGAVVYINGTEVMRTNMPSGTITSSTLASSAASGGGESNFNRESIDPSVLKIGVNTIAVEVHQSSATSSDISFDLSLGALSAVGVEPIMVLSEGRFLVKARTLLRGEWSALRNAQLLVSEAPVAPGIGDLVVSEIHYHPTDPTVEEIAIDANLSDGDFEYIELMNVSADPLDLEGCLFVAGIDYEFPELSILQPGERVVLCSQLEAFALRHDYTPLAEFGGALDNSGETLTLVDPSAVVLFEFTYGDRSLPEWPIEADGEGRSLVLINPDSGGDLNDPLEWRASRIDHGKPGESDEDIVDERFVDTDGDGFPWLVEALLMSSDDDASSLPQVETFFVLHDDGGEYLHMRFVRNLLVEGDLSVRSSSDLSDWSVEAVLVNSVLNNDSTETLEYSISDGSDELPGDGFMKIFVW